MLDILLFYKMKSSTITRSLAETKPLAKLQTLDNHRDISYIPIDIWTQERIESIRSHDKSVQSRSDGHTTQEEWPFECLLDHRNIGEENEYLVR